MASRNAVTENRRKAHRRAAGAKRKAANKNKGTTPKFAIHENGAPVTTKAPKVAVKIAPSAKKAKPVGEVKAKPKAEKVKPEGEAKAKPAAKPAAEKKAKPAKTDTK